MAVSSTSLKNISRVFWNIFSTQKLSRAVPPRTAFRYSTVVPKQFFNMLDIFTDILFVNRSTDLVSLEPDKVIECVQGDRSKVHKIDNLIANIDISNMQTMVKILINELQTNIKLKDWNGVDKILSFFIDKKVVLSQQAILNLAEEFCNTGFIAGLKSLLLLTDVTEDEHTIRGVLLHYLAKCNWRIGNARECLNVLRDCYKKYPDMNSSIKKSLRVIIHQSVSSRSEAVLRNTVDFVQEFTQTCHDYYLITILWYDLFMSDWHSDHQLANTLLTKYEYLRTSVAMLASTLGRNLVRNNRFEDVYRLLEVLLKHKMKQPYTVIIQILYDYHCMKGDKFRCSEIIKSSAILNVPLREEQYNSFISWSASGNPYKFVKPNESES